MGQKLSSSVYYSIREGDHTGFNEEVYSDPTFTQKNDYLFGSKDREESEDNELRINIDYILPVTEVTRFEFGYQADMETEDEIFTQEFLDTLTNEYFVSDEYSNEMEFSRNVHAVYGLFVSNVLDFDYQLGLRAEHTDRSVFLPLSNEDYIIDRVDFFPSLNFSRQFEGRHQIIGGYSRRINRPRGHWLEPFPSYRDPYSYRIGNPEIEPEYTDSYEIGYQKYFDKSYISLETYFRHTTNKFERFSEIDEDGLLRYSSRNIGSSDAIGTEVSFNLKPFSWMNFNIVSNVYYYTIESDTLATSAAESDDVTWNLRGFLDFNLTSSLRLQFSSFYNAPEISTQGQREAFFFVDAGLRYDMFERKLSLTLNARNLFDTMGYEATSSGLNFSNYFKFEREARVVQLTISYRFNDFEPERRRGNGGGDMEGDMDF